MANPPNDEDEGTVILPAGATAPRPALEGKPKTDWDNEATRVIANRDETGVVEPDTAPEGPDGPGLVPPPELAKDTVLGNYKVGKLIARGGLGAIYEGFNIHNPAERVAIKTILPEPGMRERFGKMLLDEANALMHVRHDAVVPYRTYGRIADTDEFYLVLEYIDGDALNDYYRSHKLSETELFALARRLAAGLHAAHQEGLIHRDVSPDNVLLPGNRLDEATLIDFGIAKMGDIEDLPDQKFVGKLTYAAPEQFVSGGKLGPWTDIYSLALLLVAAARGQAIPMGRTIEDAQEARCAVPDLPGVPDALAGPLRKMLEPHPADRPQSMKDILAIMIAAERGAANAAVLVPPKVVVRDPKREEPQRRRRRANGGLVSAVLALLIGGAVAGIVLMYGNGMFGTSPGGGAPPIAQPPQPSRAQALATISETLRTRLATQPCSAVRLTATDTGTGYALDVGGAWQDDTAMRKAADALATETGATISVNGQAVNAPLCGDVGLIKPLLASRGSALLARPVATGRPDRSVSLTIVPDPTRPYIYVFEVDNAGLLSALVDLSPAGRPKLVADQRLTESGDGHLQVVLKPATADANVGQTLLLAVAARDNLPASMAAASGVPLADWIAALGQSDVTVDATPRDGVPATVASTGNIQKSRDELLADARAAISAHLDAEPCNLVRLSVQDGGPPFQFTIGGVWGDASRMQQAATDAAEAAQANVILSGMAIDPSLCPDLSGVRAAALPLGPPIMDTPQPSATDRSVSVVIAPPKDQSELFLLEASKDGRITNLVDLSPAGLTSALSKGTAEHTPDGRLRVRLAAGGDADHVAPTLLIAASATSGLSATIPHADTALQDWIAQLAKAKPAGLSLDLAERPGMAGKIIDQQAGNQTTASGGLSTATHDRLQAVACSLLRVTLEGQGDSRSATVSGLWGSVDAVQAAATEASNAEHIGFTVKGSAVASRHCSRLDALKPFFKDGEPETLTALASGSGNDGSSILTIKPDPGYAHLDLVWIDSQGSARSLFDVADMAAVSRFRQRNLLTQNGDGSFSLIVPPYSADKSTPSGLFVAVASKDPLPANLLASRQMSFKAWQGQLSSAAGATALRVDAIEYREAGGS